MVPMIEPDREIADGSLDTLPQVGSPGTELEFAL